MCCIEAEIWNFHQDLPLSPENIFPLRKKRVRKSWLSPSLFHDTLYFSFSNKNNFVDTMDITKFAIPEIIFGRGSLRHVAPCAQRLGARRILLVSEEGIEQAGWVEKLRKMLSAEGIEQAYYSNVSSNPRDFQIEEGARFYREQKADVILAIGGGSTLDTAKGIAIIASNGGKISDYEGANQVHNPLPPMLFITTTAGSGSDVSQFCIVTSVERQVKMAIISRTLIPNISIIDPLLLSTISRTQIIYSAVDAIAHAVEAYLSIISSPLTELHSLRAVDKILAALPQAAENKSFDAMEELSLASLSAGIAFSNASLGSEHALAHSLGGHFDMPHGVVHPILLPAFMRYNLDFAEKKLARLGEVILNRRQGNDRETALAGIARLEEFFGTLGVSTRLRDEVPPEKRNLLKEVCQMAVNDACTLTNPRPTSAHELLTVCEEVW